MRTAIRRFLVQGTAVLGALMLAAACGPGSSKPTTSPSPAASASPSVSPSPAPGAGAATAIDAYRGMWTAYVAAIKIPDPAYPDLSKYMQGDALSLFTKGLTSVQRDGLVGQGDVTINPAVTAANPNATPPTVEFKDCADTAQTRLVKKDGSAYQDTPGGKRAVKATVSRLPDGSWKVSSVALFDVGTC